MATALGYSPQLAYF